MPKGVLLDTSFFLRFLNDQDPLFKNADGYYKYFISNQITMYISTISIAEYCVGGGIDELPLKDLQIIPFNVDHAQKTGEFAKIIFQNKNQLQLQNRAIIPNDCKLFSQADKEKSLEFYLSSDSESLKIFNLLKTHTHPKFQFIDLNNSHGETFGILDM